MQEKYFSDFLDKQPRIEKESWVNLAAYVDHGV